MRVLPIALFLAVSTPVASMAGSLQGRVTSEKGEPLPYANVVLLGTKLGAATDREGFYRVLNVNPGRYTVRVSYLGYERAEFTIFAKENPFVETVLPERKVRMSMETLPTVICGCSHRSRPRFRIDPAVLAAAGATPKIPVLTRNPFADRTGIRFTAEEPAAARLRIFDIRGRLLRDEKDIRVLAGENVIPIERGALASGVYWTVLTWGEQSAKKKMVVLPR